MAHTDDEEGLLRSVALQNAQSIHLARQRAEAETVRAKEALHVKTRELAKSLAMMHATLEATTDGILVTDGDGRVTDFNENWLRMWQISREEMASEKHREIIKTALGRHFTDPERFIGRIDEIYAASPPQCYDLLELADGRVFERFSRIQYIGEQNVGRVWSLRDISDHVRAREDLRKQAEWWRVTLESIGDAVITADVEGRVTFLNSVAEALTGWKNDEVAGQPLPAVFHIVNETTRQTVENPALRALSEGLIVGLANHTILITRDGVERPIDDSAAPIKDESGSISGVVLVFRDVTAQRQAERDLRERAAVSAFEAETGTVLTRSASIDEMLSRCADIMVRHLNGAFARVWLLNERENVLELRASAGQYTHLDGAHSRIAVGQYKIGLIAESRKPTLTNAVVGDLRVHDQDWARREGMVAFAGYPLLVGEKLVGVLAMFARHELLKTTLQAMAFVAGSMALAIEQKRQANELRKIAAELSEADRRKNEFLAMLAHELRNPLAPIRNALQIVKLTHGKDEAVQTASEMMERQIGHMVRLVDDLLDISRITRGKIDLRRELVELSSIVSQAVETCRPTIEAARHELTVTLPEHPVFLHADAARLSQVFSNLLNNACKYSEPAGRIWLSAERQANEAVVSVRDAGIGISREMLPKIFEMFTQVDQSLERSQGGLGIGLTLVQRLVEMHGGSVTAMSAGPALGSEFVVRIPIAVDQAVGRPKPTMALSIAPISRRILVVDDNRDSATSLAALLKLSGNETQTAYDGLQAMEAAASFRPDVMLLDIGLPKLNGYEVARKIREQPWGKKLMLVALTGWGQEEDRKKSQEAGFDAHMIKPVDHSALAKLLAELQPKAEA
jgi:PAS domain S-box-containing protein